MNEDKVRACIVDIDHALVGLSAHVNEDHRAALSALTLSWSELVRTLALGPPRETRLCPTCGRSGMREATLCGYCWAHLTPPPPASPGASAE